MSIYQTGELVVYGGSGVCRVDAVGPAKGDSSPGGRCFYTLSPVYGTETIYAPVDTKVFMRPVLTRQEAVELIAGIPSIREEELEECSVPVLNRRYQSSFESHECTDLIRLIKTIHARDDEARRRGRQPGRTEEKYRKRAEELLHGELAAALDLPLEAIPSYIHDSMQIDRNSALV